jgi:hypothetical protein
MVDISQRLCTPQQAKFFAEKGVLQKSQYAWQLDKGIYILMFEGDADTGLPKVIDWSEDADTYAAFDNTDLGIMLATLGYFPAGPTARLDVNENEHFRWWCDDIATFTQIEDTIYQAYGRTEAEAKGFMLQKLIDTGKAPLDWEHYRPDRLTRMQAMGKIYGKKTEDQTTNPEDTF